MINFPKLEEKILKFWQKNKIFEKSLKAREKYPRFVFYEGPPFANARPGIHHVQARSFKDIIARYKTMKGFLVERRAGWDTHGLPTEMEVEKKLGTSCKSDIEKLGVEKFTKACRESIFTYKKQWEEMTERIGYWLDLKNAYVTCTNEYIESVWWILKQIWDKGLIYQDYKVLPYCPRCGTSLSDHEVAQGYKEVKDPSIYVKFKIKTQNSKPKTTNLLAWTTTPWTLPGNVALAVSKNIEYVKVKNKDEELILAKDCLSVLDGKHQILERFFGKDLIGLEYEPLFTFVKPDKKAYKVVEGDFVKTDEGTGIVHMAPAFGAEDLEVAKKENLAIILNVDQEGKFKKEVKPWAGKFVKNADPEIIFDLEKRGLLYKKETVLHTYPFCWRCDTPLLYYAKNSWYIKTTAVRDKMLDSNKKINWIPSYIKYGRFGNWLKENIDWALSRERYWGTPLPIWVCQKCGQQHCVGSIKELKTLSLSRISTSAKRADINLIDLHKPYIDKVKLKCPKCNSLMTRVPEVLDCWFDSGSMPFAQGHWPFAQIKNSKLKSKNLDKPLTKKEIQELSRLIPFPADFIAEGIDQTRGWFYTLLAISTLLGLGPPYKNVISLGLVLDEKGEKMSKSKGNIVFPEEIISQYGADVTRLYFYLAPLGETVRFSKKDLEEVFKKFMVTLYNCFVFLKTYAPKNFKTQNSKLKTSNLLDRWIISKLNQTTKEITESLEKYQITKAVRLLYNFVLDDLSNWYIRRSRKREEKIFYQTLYEVLLTLVKLNAPFVPFISEEIFQRLVCRGSATRHLSEKRQESKSVHLEDWPKANQKLIDQKLNEKMDLARKIVEMILAARGERKIKIRQPLKSCLISGMGKIEKEFLGLISDETNIKEIKLKKAGPFSVKLDLKITKELKEEGIARDIVRHIQGLRKERGYTPADFVFTFYQTTNPELLDVFGKFEKYILDKTRSRKLKRLEKADGKEVEIEGKKIRIFVKD